MSKKRSHPQTYRRRNSALAMGMEQSERNVMDRPPRNAIASIFSGGMGVEITLHGMAIATITILSYVVGYYMESRVWEITDSTAGITMAFLTLSLVEIFHSFNMRSRHDSIFSLQHRNCRLWGAAVLSLTAIIAVVYVPFLAAAFGFSVVSAECINGCQHCPDCRSRQVHFQKVWRQCLVSKQQPHLQVTTS